MNPKKTLDRLTHAPTDTAELARAARDLAHELPRQRPDVLGAFRAGLARLDLRDDSHATGFAAALREVAAAYEDALGPVLDDSEARRLLNRKPTHRALLQELQKEPCGTAELADRLRADKGTVSRALRSLRKWGLVTGYPSGDGRMKPQRLTNAGERVVATLRSDSPVADFSLVRLAFLLVKRVSQGPVSRAEVDALVRQALGSPRFAKDASEALIEAGIEESVLQCEHDYVMRGAHAYYPPHYYKTVKDLLWQAFRERSWPAFLHHAAIDGQQVPVLVRSAVTVFAWRPLLARLGNESRTVDKGDLLLGIETPRLYNLLYEDPLLCREDERRAPEHRLRQGAQRIACLAARREEDLPEDVIQIVAEPAPCA